MQLIKTNYSKEKYEDILKKGYAYIIKVLENLEKQNNTKYISRYDIICAVYPKHIAKKRTHLPGDFIHCVQKQICIKNKEAIKNIYELEYSDMTKGIFDIKNTTKISDEKNKMTITLNVNVFKGIEDAPFYIDVEITGYFELDGEDNILNYEANAIAIMYPYLRAIVSTYTTSANVSPIILPAINVNAMLKRKKEQEN